MKRGGSSGSDARRPARGAGFTLLELSVVIAVLAVLGVVAVPAAWWMVATRSGGAARVVVQDLTSARELAMSSGTRCWVAFDAPRDSYVLLAEDPGQPGRAGARALEDPATGWAYARRLGVGEFAGAGIVSASFEGDAEVGFDWLGRALRTNGDELRSRGVVVLSDGYGCVVEPGTGLAWTTAP